VKELLELLSLFGPALLALAALSLAAPVIGVFQHVRGAAFQGLVLPQLAAFGVALGYAVSPWLVDSSASELGAAHRGHTHAVGASDVYHLSWAGAAVLVGLAVTTALARRPGSESARLAALFAVASGGAVVCAQLSPFGGIHVTSLLSGEALAVGTGDAALVVIVALVTLAAATWAWRDVTSVLQDPDFARAIRLPVRRIDAALGLTSATLVVVGTLSIGPLPLFALLVLPPLGARGGAPSMASFLRRSALVGFLGALTGATLSFGADLPLGASVTLGSACVSLVAALLTSRKNVPHADRCFQQSEVPEQSLT